MEKVNVEIRFDRVVTYCVCTNVSKEDFEKIQDLDGDAVPMYIKENNIMHENDVYDIINEFATEDNEFDWGEEFTFVSVEKIED